MPAARSKSPRRSLPDLCARVQPEDLDEMLGNLLDNACKWAKSKIVVKASRGGSMIVFTVDDDGAGLERAMRSAVLERGVRIDEGAPGSGLGLAIVRDLAELYGGAFFWMIRRWAGCRRGCRFRLRAPHH